MSERLIDETVRQAVERARSAQAEARDWSQQRVDDVVAALGWHAYQEGTAQRLAQLSHEETGLGDPGHLLALHRTRVLGMLHDLHGQRTVGVVEDLAEQGLRRIAKPVGVIAVATPATAPSPGIICNALMMLKTRNAVVFTPNPRAGGVARETVALLRRALEQVGAPADLVQCLDVTGRHATEALMAAADLVVAVGGTGTVRRAYSSGTPAISAGVGNPTVIVDETADPRHAARMIAHGAAYNNGTSCSSESNVLVHRSSAAVFRAALLRAGAHLCSRAETTRLRDALWPDGVTLNRDLVGRSADALVTAARIALDAPGPPTLLVLDCAAPEQGGPLLLEKLSPVLTLATFDDYEQAVELTRTLSDLCGRGHSCGIHTTDPARVARLAEVMPTSRVVVNQSTMTNAGSFTSGTAFTTTLGSGSWGGSSVSGNVTWRHFLNHTTVSWPVEERLPDEQVVFGRHWQGAGARPLLSSASAV